MLGSSATDQQYVLSLDSLDLNLLSQYIERPARSKRLLWSKPDMDGETVYCEVQVPMEELQDENSYIEPMETYMCHICNIDVPQPYYKHHNKSRKHQHYKKLSEKAVQNILKQINVDIDFSNNDNHHDKFYCEICSKVVLTKHKRKHNRSKYHLQSIESQKNADDFIEKYVGNTEVEDTKMKNGRVSNKSYKNIKRNEINCSSDSDTDWNFESDIENEPVTNANQVIKINNVFPTTSENPKKNVVNSNVSTLQTSKEINEFQLYLKEMIAKYNLKFKLPTIEDNSIVIVTPKGHKEKISINEFHGYKKSNNCIICQICRVSVDLDTSEHSRTKEHMNNIIQPIDDNFAREIIGLNGWKHCLLCNMIVNNANHADINVNHRKYNKASTSKEKETPKEANLPPKKTFCDVCKVFIDTHNFAGHIQAKKHLNKLKTVPENSTLVTPDASIASSDSVAQNRDLYCDVCKVKVPKGGMDIHREGKSHKNKCIKEIKRSVEEFRSEFDKFKSAIMDKDLTLKSDLPSTSKAKPNSALPTKSVIRELTKQEKLLEYKRQMANLSATEVKCKVCDLKVPILDNNIIEHVEGARHKKAAEEILNENKLVNTSVKSYHCKLCKVNFSDFMYHINEDVDHIIKIILSRPIIDKLLLRKYMYESRSALDSTACAYRGVYKELLQRNRIVRLNDMSFYCGACSINVSQVSEIDHMFGERHKSFLNADKLAG